MIPRTFSETGGWMVRPVSVVGGEWVTIPTSVGYRIKLEYRAGPLQVRGPAFFFIFEEN